MTSSSLPLRICVLQSSYESSASSMKSWDDFDCTPAYFVKDSSYLFESVKISKASAYMKVRELILSRRYDVFLNLCDGAKDEDRAGLDVILALEDWDGVYTGVDSAHYEPTKVQMKQALFGRGILFPHFAALFKEDDLVKETAYLSMPVIVKHPSGYSSVFMTLKSKCQNLSELAEQVQIFFEQAGQALVEEFIEGREVSVLAVQDPSAPDGVFVYDPVEVFFPEGESFKHFEMKWADHKGMNWRLMKEEDSKLKEQIKFIGKEAFKAILGGVGYGRSDLRITEDGRIYFLEINPNCGIFYPQESFGSADYILHYAENGFNHFTQKIIEAAFVQRSMRRLARGRHRLSYHPQKGFYLRADGEIQKGSLVFSYEQSPFYLVSRHHVESSWSEGDRQLFSEYAWPLSEQVFVVWSKDPRDWKPINHSCDPNLWLGDHHGFDVYARRDILPGEELSIDYATFVAGDTLASFACSCLSLNCRKHIRPRDFLEHPKLQEAYGKRVTDFVYQKRRSFYAACD